MPLHTGLSYCHHQICIGQLDPDATRRVPQALDIRDAVAFYLDAAPTRADIYTFGIYADARLVGQISLHDIDWHTHESLVAYHLFLPDDRGRGIGTTALTLLQQYVRTATSLTRVFAITSRDNIASQRIAAKSGFQLVGPAREDPEHLLVFVWDVPTVSSSADRAEKAP